MTMEMFDEKWLPFLEEGFDGLTINDENVINYLDKEFEKEIIVNSNFTYAQIKLKFGSSRVYANSSKDREWEITIDQILNDKSN